VELDMALTEELDMALKLRAVKDRMDYSEVVIAALEQYLGVKSTKKKGRDGAKS
jgi:metal-responsive CopG/Arc/MetJ family transcriptional regulator